MRLPLREGSVLGVLLRLKAFGGRDLRREGKKRAKKLPSRVQPPGWSRLAPTRSRILQKFYNENPSFRPPPPKGIPQRRRRGSFVRARTPCEEKFPKGAGGNPDASRASREAHWKGDTRRWRHSGRVSFSRFGESKSSSAGPCKQQSAPGIERVQSPCRRFHTAPDKLRANG